MPVSISRLADRLRVSTDTLRYYERLGLVPGPARAGNGYRIFDGAAGGAGPVHQRRSAHGPRRSDVKELLISGTRDLPCGHTPEVVERQLADVDAEMARLQTMKRDLVTLGQRNRASADLSTRMGGGHTTDGERG